MNWPLPFVLPIAAAFVDVAVVSSALAVTSCQQRLPQLCHPY